MTAGEQLPGASTLERAIVAAGRLAEEGCIELRVIASDDAGRVVSEGVVYARETDLPGLVERWVGDAGAGGRVEVFARGMGAGDGTGEGAERPNADASVRCVFTATSAAWLSDATSR